MLLFFQYVIIQKHNRKRNETFAPFFTFMAFKIYFSLEFFFGHQITPDPWVDP